MLAISQRAERVAVVAERERDRERDRVTEWTEKAPDKLSERVAGQTSLDICSSLFQGILAFQ